MRKILTDLFPPNGATKPFIVIRGSSDTNLTDDMAPSRGILSGVALGFLAWFLLLLLLRGWLVSR
jgi:hypothetical protein